MVNEGRAGSYELLKQIAKGGMAEVFLARFKGMEGFEKKVVLKRVLPHLARDERLIRMFLDEARLAAQLSHPNIAQIFELGQLSGDWFIAMELVEGKDLAALILRLRERSERLPVEHALRILCFVLEALAYAHERRDAAGRPLGLVHRDVSASNVLVSFDGAVKLIDFGIAKASARLSETQPGAVLGKLAYMAPEQFTGSRVDARTDLFSAGVLLYGLLTGEQPFLRQRDASHVEGLGTPIGDPRAARADLPDSVVPVLMKAMAEDPADRYPSARAMQLELEKILVHGRLLSTSALLGETMRRLFPEALVPDRVEGDDEPRTQTSVAPDPPSSPPSLNDLPTRLLPAPVSSDSSVTAVGASSLTAVRAASHTDVRVASHTDVRVTSFTDVAASALERQGAQRSVTDPLPRELEPPTPAGVEVSVTATLPAPTLGEGAASTTGEASAATPWAGAPSPAPPARSASAGMRQGPRLAGVALGAGVAAVVVAAGIIAVIQATRAPGLPHRPVVAAPAPVPVVTALSPAPVVTALAPAPVVTAPAPVPIVAAPAPVVTAPAPVPVVTAPAPAPVVEAPPAKGPPRKRAVHREEPAKGTLDVKTDPPADVFLDARRLGRSPLKVPVAVGHHKITLVAGEVTRTVQLDVTEDETSRVVLRLLP